MNQLILCCSCDRNRSDPGWRRSRHLLVVLWYLNCYWGCHRGYSSRSKSPIGRQNARCSLALAMLLQAFWGHWWSRDGGHFIPSAAQHPQQGLLHPLHYEKCLFLERESLWICLRSCLRAPALPPIFIHFHPFQVTKGSWLAFLTGVYYHACFHGSHWEGFWCRSW